ncbi:MAG: HAMP domain-containing sensor histidine kinase [Ferruginibacter sp.]
MKLFTKYSRTNFIATVIIFLLAGVAFFYLLQYILIHQVDESLETEQQEITSFIQEHGQLPEIIPVKDQQITYTHTTGIIKEHFKTLTAYDSVEKETSKFRQFIFPVQVNGQTIEINVGKSLEGTEDLERSIIIITISTILLMLVTGFIINRLILRKLWRPFYQSLQQMQDFKLGKKATIDFSHSNTDEFNLLNKTLATAFGKAERDYQSLKEFTENASHELQTPLAIIRSKLDLLVQDEHLSEQQSNAVQAANEAIQKLSRLNQSLLLLAKIENKQFDQTSSINLKIKIEEKISYFRELLQEKNLSVTKRMDDISVSINEQLADVLLNNLIGNAIRHTNRNGLISIELNREHLGISNTAVAGSLNNARLFHRFYKEGPSPEQHGLGLSIVKQICEAYGYNILYSFKNHEHHFIIYFK